MYHGICLWRVGSQPIRARRPWLFRSKITWGTRVSVSLICAMNLNLLVCGSLVRMTSYKVMWEVTVTFMSLSQQPASSTRNDHPNDHPIFESWVKPITLVGRNFWIAAIWIMSCVFCDVSAKKGFSIVYEVCVQLSLHVAMKTVLGRQICGIWGHFASSSCPCSSGT